MLEKYYTKVEYQSKSMREAPETLNSTQFENVTAFGHKRPPEGAIDRILIEAGEQWINFGGNRDIP